MDLNDDIPLEGNGRRFIDYIKDNYKGILITAAIMGLCWRLSCVQCKPTGLQRQSQKSIDSTIDK